MYTYLSYCFALYLTTKLSFLDCWEDNSMSYTPVEQWDKRIYLICRTNLVEERWEKWDVINGEFISLHKTMG